MKYLQQTERVRYYLIKWGLLPVGLTRDSKYILMGLFFGLLFLGLLRRVLLYKISKIHVKIHSLFSPIIIYLHIDVGILKTYCFLVYVFALEL